MKEVSNWSKQTGADGLTMKQSEEGDKPEAEKAASMTSNRFDRMAPSVAKVQASETHVQRLVNNHGSSSKQYYHA